jgi:hypothetical protein
MFEYNINYNLWNCLHVFFYKIKYKFIYFFNILNGFFLIIIMEKIVFEKNI